MQKKTTQKIQKEGWFWEEGRALVSFSLVVQGFGFFVLPLLILFVVLVLSCRT